MSIIRIALKGTSPTGVRFIVVLFVISANMSPVRSGTQLIIEHAMFTACHRSLIPLKIT